MARSLALLGSPNRWPLPITALRVTAQPWLVDSASAISATL
jgi:hypothetical protein